MGIFGEDGDPVPLFDAIAQQSGRQGDYRMMKFSIGDGTLHGHADGRAVAILDPTGIQDIIEGHADIRMNHSNDLS